jgi:hypothetical protein
VRRDFGVNRNTGFSWGAGDDAAQTSASNVEPEQDTGGKGKKKKKVLVQWG